MTITRADFLRLLPAAVHHAPFVVAGENIVHREGNRCWQMRLTPLPELKLGAIRLERQRLELAFENYPETEIAAFIERFELYFRRGGG